jgi:outer membrane cobalamin receptor
LVNAGLEIRRVGDRIDRDFSSFQAARITLPAFTVVDIHGEVTVRDGGASGPGFSLLIRGENILDAEYSEIQGFPARGRTLWMGGRLQLGGK